MGEVPEEEGRANKGERRNRSLFFGCVSFISLVLAVFFGRVSLARKGRGGDHLSM